MESRAAKMLLDDPLVTSVLTKLRADSLQTIANSAPTDMTLREQAYQDLRAVNRFQENLQSLANDLIVYKS
jgi:hypothetical protein